MDAKATLAQLRRALEAMESGRADLAGVQRALVALLRGQIAILERLAPAEPTEAVAAAPPPPRRAPRDASALADLDSIRVLVPRPRRGDPEVPARAAPEPVPVLDPSPEPEPASAPPAVPADRASPGATAAALAAFPLEELNRWLDSGTIFQIRGALAFLNLRSMGGLKADEMKANIRRLGFSDDLGRLAAEGLAGEILLLRRAE